MFGLQQAQTGMSASGFGAYGNTRGFGGLGFGATPGGVDGSMMALGQQQQLFSGMMTQMMEVMGTFMNLMMLKQMQAVASGASNFGGASGSGTSGISDFLGGGSSGAAGGAAPAAGAAAAGASTDPSGSSAVDIAKKYLGRKSGEINDMSNFTHAGGMTNNCADFVSACLANAGVYKKKPGDASVRILKGHLIEDGWKKVSKAQAKPGDVAIFNGTQHIELVATQGATQLIGSNNKGNASTQTVSMDSGNWGSVEYYSKG